MNYKILITLVYCSFWATLPAQPAEEYRIPLLGEEAPSFVAQSTQGEIKFPDDYFNKWKILFSHPADFTPVCSSEILTLASMQDEFKELNTVLIVLSTDGINSHLEWIKSLEGIDYNGLGYQEIRFPLLSDVDLHISKKYGMVEANSGRSQNIRGVFIIDDDNIIRGINFYSVNTGRNMDEILRTVVALQSSEKYDILTPANWNPGDPVMIPGPSTVAESQKLQSKSDPSLKMITWYMWMKIL